MMEPIAGNAGWVGAGLLGLVLMWLLFKHLPEKDRQTAQLLESRDRVTSEHLHGQRQSFMERHSAVMEEVREIRRQFAQALAQQAEVRQAVEMNSLRIYEWTKLMAKFTGSAPPPSDPQAKPPPPGAASVEIPAFRVEKQKPPG